MTVLAHGMRHILSRVPRRIETSRWLHARFGKQLNIQCELHTAASQRASPAATTVSKMAESADYSGWSHEKLIKRVSQLEAELKAKNERFGPIYLLKSHSHEALPKVVRCLNSLSRSLGRNHGRSESSIPHDIIPVSLP